MNLNSMSRRFPKAGLTLIFGGILCLTVSACAGMRFSPPPDRIQQISNSSLKTLNVSIVETQYELDPVARMMCDIQAKQHGEKDVWRNRLNSSLTAAGYQATNSSVDDADIVLRYQVNVVTSQFTGTPTVGVSLVASNKDSTIESIGEEGLEFQLVSVCDGSLATYISSKFINKLSSSNKLMAFANSSRRYRAPSKFGSAYGKAKPENSPRGVAIVRWSPKGGTHPSTAEALTSTITATISSGKCIRVVEADIMNDVASQKAREQSFGSEAHQIDLAKQAQADFLIRGDISWIGGDYVISLLAINLSNNETVYSGRMNAPEKELLLSADKLAKQASEVLSCQ